MEAYLDNSATTRALEAVKDIVVEAMMENYGNPSAMHTKGMEAEQYIKKAKEDIAKILKVEEKEILFTSGGTESNNLAIIGTAMANKRSGMHIITSQIEHASVNQPMAFLEEQGFRVTYLPVDKEGHILLDALKDALCDETILVSIMHVNNEMGAVEPIEEIGKIIKARNPNIVYHVDDIQGFGKFHTCPKRLGIDLLSVSGHKIHGPKGIGFLYINDKIKIKPLILGGGQQKGMRSGTENVPGIAGLGVAAREAYADFDEKIRHMCEVKDYLIDGLSSMDEVTINSKKGLVSAPHIVSASFAGVRSEVLLHALEEKQIYVSAGSACSSNKPAVSRTLKAIQVKKELLDSTIRFSICEFTTKEEIDYTLKELKALFEMLKRYRRK